MGLDFSGFESLLLLQHQSQLGYSLSDFIFIKPCVGFINHFKNRNIAIFIFLE